MNARQRFEDIAKAGNCLLFIDTVGGVAPDLSDLSVAIQTDTVSPSFGVLGLSIACNASARDTPKIMAAIAASKLKPISKGNLRGRTTIGIYQSKAQYLHFKAKISLIV